jgi:hypothetical protein
MERPIFVVLRKAFHQVAGYDVSYCPCGQDVQLFLSYDAAMKAALAWCHATAKRVEVCESLGEISRASAQYGDLVAQIVGNECTDRFSKRIGCEIYQKYVL